MLQELQLPVTRCTALVCSVRWFTICNILFFLFCLTGAEANPSFQNGSSLVAHSSLPPLQLKTSLHTQVSMDPVYNYVQHSGSKFMGLQFTSLSCPVEKLRRFVLEAGFTIEKIPFQSLTWKLEWAQGFHRWKITLF